MIAILTDKPNVGKEIARILGAQTRENGYMTGNGYMVTWLSETCCHWPCRKIME